MMTLIEEDQMILLMNLYLEILQWYFLSHQLAYLLVNY